MYFLKYPLADLLVALILFGACKNNSGHTDEPLSLTESNPAYKNLNDSIRVTPNDDALYLRRANRLMQENVPDLAYADYLKAWTLQPKLENALPFAVNLAILSKPQERISLIETLYSRFPANNQVERLMAEAYAASGNTEKALTIYERMITTDSLNPEPHYEKALLYELKKDTATAIAELQKAYSIQQIDIYGLELANLLAEQKNPKALDICNFIIKQDSGHIFTDPFFIKGIYYANTKQYQKAISQFDSCILRDWKTTDAYLEKGRIYFQLKNYNTAIQTFSMAITVTNTDPDAYYWLGRAYEAKHMKKEAIVNYTKAISLDKNFTEATQRMENLTRGFAHPSH